MSEEVSFETYLVISKKKFGIYLLDKINLKNIYEQELYFENSTDQIDYNLLSQFLDKNIFKIEKLRRNFLKSIFLIIENNKILDFSIGIKKKNYSKKINRQFLESSLTELKHLFKENYKNNKILHFYVDRYLIDGANHSLFDKEIDGDHICVEANFISIPTLLTKEISEVLEKYQIKIDRFFDKKYIQNFFQEQTFDLSVCAFKMKSGQNQNEILLISKTVKKKGFFEKFFQLFS